MLPSRRRRGQVVSTWRWFHFLPLRDLIDRRTAPVNEDYLLVFGEAPAQIGGRKITTGYTDFTERRCWVHGSVLPGAASEEEQILASTFVAAHERAHARWTDFHPSDFTARTATGEERIGSDGEPVSDLLLHQVWNILEDERIERLLMREFRYLAPYLVKGSGLLLALIDKVQPLDDPSEVIKWVLRRRVATRAGITEPCPLHAKNVALLAEIEPLLDEAFECDNSRRVVEIARDIIARLRLDAPKGVTGVGVSLSGQQGYRGPDDAAAAGGVSQEDADADLSEALEQAKDGGTSDSLITQSGYTPYRKQRRGELTRAPYEALRNEVRPMVAPLTRALLPPPERVGVMYERTGGRLSMRAARRTPETPFRVQEALTQHHPIALTVVIDESGSMSGEREVEAKKVAMLCAETLTGRHMLRVVLAPSGRVVVDRQSGELGKAMIAGYSSDMGTEFAPTMVRELQTLKSVARNYTRYLVLIADGLSGGEDRRRLQEAVRKARAQRIHTVGIGIRLDSAGRAFFTEAFRDAFIAIDHVSHLPGRMQQLLQRMVRRSKGGLR